MSIGSPSGLRSLRTRWASGALAVVALLGTAWAVASAAGFQVPSDDVTDRAAAVAPDSRYRIELIGEAFTPPPRMPAGVLASLQAQAASAVSGGRSRLHVLVQLHEIPDVSERADLAVTGLDLGPYASGQAWVAS